MSTEMPKPLPEHAQQALALAAAGYTVAQIARATDRSRQAVRASLKLGRVRETGESDKQEL